VALALPTTARARQDAVAGAAALTSIHMNTGLAGWAINHQSAIIRTTNGGVSWSDVTPSTLLPARVTVTATYFPTVQVAWAALTDAAAQNPTLAIIIHTGDGGRTWQRGTVRLANPGQIGEILFLAGGRIGWLFAALGAGAGSQAAQIFRTTDGGMHWLSVSTTTPPHSSPGSLPFGGIKSGIGFRNALAGFATGIVYGPPGFSYLYATGDGGHTWRHQRLALPPAYRGDNPALTPPIFFTARDGLLPATLAGLVQLIYVTHDGGATWTATTPLPNARNLDIVTLRDMWAVESAGVAAGSAGRPLRLYVTHDGGFHWSAVGPNKAIRDGATLDFIDNQTGFVLYPVPGSSSQSSLLKTVDGGHSWSAIHSYVLPRSSRGIHPYMVLNNILDLSFIDTSRGWALGTSCPSTAARCRPAVRTTRDGGRTWSAVAAPLPSLRGRPDDFSARHISFADGRTGWAFYPGLFVTRDGGRTWAADGRIGEVAALAPLAGTVWAVSETCAAATPSRCASTLWISPDGGRTWRRAPTQPGVGGTAEQLIRASARDAWILSSGPSAAMLAATHDGGATWRAQVDPCDTHAKGVIDRLAVSSGKLWLLCGGEPGARMELKALYVSDDGGQNWRLTAATGNDTPQHVASWLPASGYVDSIAATTLKHAWIGLDRGTLYETSDGGCTWQAAIPMPILNPLDATVGSLVFVDSMHGWVAAYNRVFHTVDGGAHWQAVTVR
jgi:photosystem II stability/assembly factor-like uncharacterized protein